jgi:hypothetical protein
LSTTAWTYFCNWHLRLDSFEKANELLVPVSLHLGADDGIIIPACRLYWKAQLGAIIRKGWPVASTT